MLHEYARQGVEDPESPEGSVSAQTMDVDLKEKNYYFIHFAFEKPLSRSRSLWSVFRIRKQLNPEPEGFESGSGCNLFLNTI